MNPRTKDLARQAREQTEEFNSVRNKLTAEEWTEIYNEKFAELIVGECMTTILKESKWYWDKDEFESSNAIQNTARRVKEHFGIEE